MNDYHVPSFEEHMNEAKQMNESLKVGSKILTKKDLELPVYNMLRKQNAGAKGSDTTSIKKGTNIEIHKILKSSSGEVIYVTNFGAFDADVLENIK